MNQKINLQDLFPSGFIRPERFVYACHVFHFSGDPQLVWMNAACSTATAEYLARARVERALSVRVHLRPCISPFLGPIEIQPISLVSSGLFAVNDETNVQDVLLLGFRWPDSLVNVCYVFDFSSDPQLVWMIRRVFGSLRRVLTEAKLRSLFALGQDSGQRLRH
jgi:hypothetical protein